MKPALTELRQIQRDLIDLRVTLRLMERQVARVERELGLREEALATAPTPRVHPPVALL